MSMCSACCGPVCSAMFLFRTCVTDLSNFIGVRGHLQTKNFTLNVIVTLIFYPPPLLNVKLHMIKLTFRTLGGDPGMPFWPLRRLRTTSLHLHAICAHAIEISKINVMLICQRPPPPFSVTMTLSVKILVCRCPLMGCPYLPALWKSGWNPA